MTTSHIGCLEQVETQLQNAGVVCARIDPTSDAPAQLIVLLDVDETDDEQALEDALRLNVFFFPQLVSPAVMQYFVELPVVVEAAHAAALAEFLCLVNSSVPITGFEMSAALGSAAFRHTHAISTETFDIDVVMWTMAMVHLALHQAADLVVGVGNGHDVHAATAELIERLNANQPSAPDPA